MIDNKIVGMGWLRLSPGTYRKRMGGSYCNTQLEIDVEDPTHILCLPCDGPYQDLAPLRILSFDIECASEKGRFPKPETDAIIQIANIVKIQGETEPFIRRVFCYKECAPIVGTQVLSFASE